MGSGVRLMPADQSTEHVTRAEFAMLSERVGGVERRIESIDVNGSRGVLVLGAQVADLIKDFSELRVSTGQRFTEVESKVDKQSAAINTRLDREAQQRTSGRRWLIGLAVAGLGGFGTVITMLGALLHHVH